MKRWLLFMFVAAIVFVLGACGNGNEENTDGVETSEPPVEEGTEGNTEQPEENEGEEAPAEKLTVELKNPEGDKVGTAELEEKDTGVVINLNGTNLPAGEHGFHIHEKGVCEAPDFKSAGGHFNPTDATHGKDHGEGTHAGDLPNIMVGEDGTVEEEITAEQVTLKSGEANSLLSEEGTSLVIHEKADDYKSQPSGDAGSRIACGVIE